jgi:hypothetical protein
MLPLIKRSKALSRRFDHIALMSGEPGNELPQRSSVGTRAAPPRAIQWLAAGVCSWSLMLAPIEAATTDGSTQMWALITAKLMLLGVGCCAIAGIAPLRHIFVFVCAVSVLAVAPALPLTYAVSTVMFALSMVDCGLKSALVWSYARHYLGKS